MGNGNKTNKISGLFCIVLVMMPENVSSLCVKGKGQYHQTKLCCQFDVAWACHVTRD